MVISTVLLDLDGVVRHFDKSRVPAIERQHGLPGGSLRSTAFAPELLERATTGKITRAEWTRQVGEAVGSQAAAEDWLNNHGVPDDRMIELAGELRSNGTTVAVLTNGTDTVPEELTGLGIAGAFDAVFTTAAIGYAKPDRRAFQHVCDALQVAPHTVFFTDDTPSKLTGAIELGMDARPFESYELLLTQLTEVGCLPA